MCLVICKDVLPLRLLTAENGVENLLRLPRSVSLEALNSFGDVFHFLFHCESLEQVGEVLNIILVVHLCELLEDDELIDARVHQIAALLFELHYIFLVVRELGLEFLEDLICFS